MTDKGMQFKHTCSVCKNRIDIICSGDDLSYCPYCAVSLMDESRMTEEGYVEVVIPRAQQLLIMYRNGSSKERFRIRIDLASRLLDLHGTLMAIDAAEAKGLG